MTEGHYAYLFLLALIGHLIGDFGLQPKRWALGKADWGWEGASYCAKHVSLYTLIICFILPTPVVMWMRATVWAAVFIPHWIIDRWSLASWWLKMIGGRTFETVIMPERNVDGFGWREPRDYLRHEFDVAFTSIVYTVTDSMWHIICLWVAIRLLF